PIPLPAIPRPANHRLRCSSPVSSPAAVRSLFPPDKPTAFAPFSSASALTSSKSPLKRSIAAFRKKTPPKTLCSTIPSDCNGRPFQSAFHFPLPPFFGDEVKVTDGPQPIFGPPDDGGR